MSKQQYILKEGRITLIQSALFSLLIYFLSLFCILRAIQLRLEQIQRNFLWGGGVLEHKPYLVKWLLFVVSRGKGVWMLKVF